MSTSRLESVAQWLPSNTAALINAPHHLCYLAGFPSGDSWLLITKQAAYFLTDFRYTELAQQTVRGAECVQIRKLSKALPELLAKHAVSTLLIETEQTPLSDVVRLRAALSDITVSDSDALDKMLGRMRAVKSQDEVRRIEQAQALAEAGFEHILGYIREGVTEREVALELEMYVRKQGAQRVAFDFIVVSGANGSLPHGIPTDKPIKRGDFVTMDFGAVVDGYHSDMTRTVAVGTVSDKKREVYNTVLNAQLAALGVLRAGLPCVKGDAAARRLIESAGYGDCFGHGTGHGVGVEIHEQPSLSPGAGEALLQEGEVVTVEPGIYIAGECGVRIEDMVLITKDGCRNLTHSPKDLICL